MALPVCHKRAALFLAVFVALITPPAFSLPEWAEHAEETKAAARVLAERHWLSQLHRIQGLVLDERRLGDYLGPIMGHQYTLPQVQVQKSLVYTGSNYRLRRTVHDMILGKRTIKVGAIGGSITNGAKASVIGETDWFSLVGKYLKSAFPRTTFQLRNGALPATPSALMNMCLEQYVDEDVDLMFVEYVANDGANRFDEIKAKVYERLLRKLLHRPSRPAVVLLQLMPKGMAFGPGNREKVPFHGTLEDIYGAQAQYYDLPWLSFRNAMWRLSEFHVHGYNWTDFMWDQDFMHPIDPGMAAISDMVVNLIQQTSLGLLLLPLGRHDAELLQERLPPPMHAGNWEAKNLMCTYGEAFKPLADTSASSGWEFINEGKPEAPKWGYISTQPGSVLKLVVNSMRNQGGGEGAAAAAAASQGKAADEQAKEPTNVMLAYLKSYEGMGIASFECTSGCTCEPKPQVDALHSLHQSTIFLVRLLVSQAERCEISVTVLQDTRSNGHKFKVSGIMMNEYIGADITEKLHEEQWLTQLQATAHSGAERAAGAQSSSSSGGGGEGSSNNSSGGSTGSSNGGEGSGSSSGGGGSSSSEEVKDSIASGGDAAQQAQGEDKPTDRRRLRYAEVWSE